MNALSPWQLLHDLAQEVDRPRRERAARGLYELLPRLCTRLPAAHRDDAIGAVMLKLVRAEPIRPVTEHRDDPHRDGRCAKYLQAMLENWWKDQLRKRQRDPVAHATGAKPADLDNAAPDEAADDDRTEAVEAFQRDLSVVVEAAVEARPARYREDFCRDWQHTWALVTESSTMADLERQEMRGPHDRIAARNRIYQRAKRLREALLETADRLHSEGRLDATTHARIVGAITQFLLRCQRPTPPRRLQP